MQRYFVGHSEEKMKDIVHITGDDYHHIVKVMRMKNGAEVVLAFPDQTSGTFKIEDITSEAVVLKVVEWLDEATELPIHVTIVSGLPKVDKLEYVFQKGTELGAHQFVPFTSVRSVVKWDQKKSEKKLERWNKICKEAAEQSHRVQIPIVQKPHSLKEVIALSSQYDAKVIAYEDSAREGEKSVLATTLSQLERGQSLLVVFGPEGGLDREEVLKLMEHGFKPCSLGPRILRTETAPLYLLAAVSYHFECLE